MAVQRWTERSHYPDDGRAASRNNNYPDKRKDVHQQTPEFPEWGQFHCSKSKI